MGYAVDLNTISHHNAQWLGRRLATVLLFVFSIHFSVRAQQPGPALTLSGNLAIEDVFHAIQAQMNLTVTYELSMINRHQKVKVSFRNAALATVMDKVLQDYPHIGWVLVKGQVLLYERKDAITRAKEAPQLITVSGLIADPDGNPIPGANVVVKGTTKGTRTNNDGRFLLENAPARALLEISSMGYLARQFRLEGEKNLTFVLLPAVTQIEPVTVVSTGYQDLPKERSTGSFVLIDSALLHRRVGMNILDRLEGVTSGLLNYTPANQGAIAKMPTGVPLGISLRGLSTLSPNQVNTNPLVILDNFAYEGDIRNINPNDIESVTVLKDAASAGIWGARSGNGVIVLTTRKGRFGQKMTLSFNTNLTIVAKPDLYKDRNYMSAGDYIEVETELFNRGYFNADINNRTNRPPVSPLVEILARQRAGLITSEAAGQEIALLRANDLRRDMSRYVYQAGLNQQYQMNIKGGTHNLAYFLSLGYDRKKDNLVRNGINRLTITSSNTYRPVKNLELSAFLNYSQSRHELHNTIWHGNILVGGTKYRQLYPYARLADDQGRALPVVKDYRSTYTDSMTALGFMDWRYRPLDELDMAKKYTKINDLVLRAGLKYHFTSYLHTELQFQNEGQAIMLKEYRSEDMYAARNLINRFTVYDPVTGQFTYNFPRGGLLNLGNYTWRTNSFRASLNYKQRLRQHLLTAITGAEIRELSASGTEQSSIGYSDEFGTGATNINLSTLYPVNPNGQSSLAQAFPFNGNSPGMLNRFISYYAVVGYSYNQRYDFSASARKDGANLFGVRTNQKLVPLWSVGGGWNISKESFYKLKWMPLLRARLSYGFNGNVYNGSAYLTGTRTVDPLTGAPSIFNIIPANEELRWEKVRIMNAGVDFSLFKDRVGGTIEYFRKEGLDLVEQVAGLPQTGTGMVNRNSASSLTRGIDATLHATVVDRAFRWQTSLIGNWMKDEVTKYSGRQPASSVVFQDPFNLLYIVGKPLRGILSYKWAGLDAKTGDPQGYLKGEVSKDYASIIKNFHVDSLTYHGPSTPVLFGGFRNDFSFKGVHISVNVVYKLGYYFRRPGVNLNYAGILSEGMNQDYTRRWRNPGDESRTDVPSLAYPANFDRNWFYRFSEILVERADHIRLQDVRVGYTVPLAAKSGIKNMEVYCYLNNLGILWRANDHKIDPDVYLVPVTNNIPNPLSFSFGIQANF